MVNMIKAKHLLNNLLGVIFLLLPLLAFGLDSDQEQPIQAQADNAKMNYKTGINTYRGNVKITQGSTAITCDVLLTYINKKHQVEKFIATGKQVVFQTLTNNNKPPLILKGKTIYYYPQLKLVKAMGNAQITQGNDSYSAPQIIFDLKKEKISSSLSQTERTQITLDPKQESHHEYSESKSTG
jgi:lipopolysaccharide export system protein LptA